MEENGKAPDLICYLITSKCVGNCEICISDVDIPDLPTSEAKRVMKKIADGGVKIISYAGREPFMREDIFELIEYTKSLGAKLNIETTGVLLEESHLQKLGELELDMLAISVDSFEEDRCNEMGRPYLSKNHLNQIYNSCNNQEINLKLVTVVSQLTRNELEKIGAFLENHSPYVWKLRQFTPRSAGHINQKKYRISEKEFKEHVNRTVSRFSNLNIVGKTSAQQSGTAFMIFPNGQIAQPFGKGHLLHGNILNTNLKDIWNKQYTLEKRVSHRENFENTY
ncbi:MAG: radical SAM protein [archaeon]